MYRLINNINFLFVISLIIGILLVAQELFQSKSENKYLRKQSAVAMVNDIIISEDQYIKYISTLGVESIEENELELLELVLEKMIEEELLLQKGIELELHKFDIEIRKAIIQQVISSILLQNKNQVSEKELKKYFEENKNKYQISNLLHFDLIFSDKNNDQDINLIRNKITNNNFEIIKQQFHQDLFFTVPDRLISYKDCNQLLGKAVCKKIFELSTGDISNPILYEDGFLIIKIKNKIENNIDDEIFIKLYDKILFDYKNSKDDKYFRDYVEYLKENANIKRYDLDVKSN